MASLIIRSSYFFFLHISDLISLETILASLRKPFMTERFILLLSALALTENCSLLVRTATQFYALKWSFRCSGSSVNPHQSISVAFVQNDQNGMAVPLHMHYVTLERYILTYFQTYLECTYQHV